MAKILIVDDDSTDDTEVIGRAVQERHPDLVTFVRNETNLGIVGTFNKAVEMMETDYVVLLGADNRFVSNYLEKCAEALDLDQSVGVAYTHFALFGPRAPVVYGQFPQKMRGEIVGNTLGANRAFESFEDQIRHFGPTEIAEHHFTAQHDAAGIDFVQVRILGSGAMSGFEDSVPGHIIDIASRSDADTADLRGQRIRKIIAI